MSLARIEKGEYSIRLIYPVLFTLLFMALLHLPTPMMVLSKLAPMVPFIFTYYWSIQRPRVASLVAVFAVAVFHDAWSEGVIGVTPLLAIVARIAIVPNQEVFRVAPFSLRWLAFGALLIALAFVKWILISALNWTWVAYGDVVFQCVISIALYPLFNHFYAMIDRRIVLRA